LTPLVQHQQVNLADVAPLIAIRCCALRIHVAGWQLRDAQLEDKDPVLRDGLSRCRQEAWHWRYEHPVGEELARAIRSHSKTKSTRASRTLFKCHKVVQRLALFMFEALVKRLQGLNSVKAKVAKSLPPFTPRSQRPNLAPIKQCQRA